MKKNLTLSEVRALHQAGQWDAAKEGYLAILKKDAKNVDALHFLAILLGQQDNFTDGILQLRLAIQYQPNNPVLQLHLANLFKAQGSLDQAVDVLRQLLQSHPTYTPTLNNLGSVYYALGSFTEAEHYYRLAIQKQPDYVDAYYNLGLTLAKQHKLEEAITHFAWIVDANPEHAAARFQLGLVLTQQDKIAEAIESFLAIDRVHPFHFETQVNLATCYLKQGAQEEAKNYYLKALELAPRDTQILFNLGVIYTQQGLMDSAIQYYQRAIQADPDFFDAHNNLGVAFLAKQHVGFALNHFKEALRLKPYDAAIQYSVQMLSKDQRLLAAPIDYIKNLFNFYANHYEPHLLKSLDYQVPTFLFRAVSDSKKLPLAPTWDILDLGCGTGLCAPAWKPFAKTLVGVDLSERMLEIARQKNLYDTLVENTIDTFLSTQQATFDVILAGDVLVYMGDLEKLFVLVQQALKPHGLFVFNTEISEHEPFMMNQSGRFSHQKSYLDQLTEQNHFTLISYKTMITRTQNHQPVFGHLCVLQVM